MLPSPTWGAKQAFDGHAIDTWSVGTTLFMALLGVQPWEEVGDFKFQAIAEGKNLDVVLQGWKLRDAISDEAVDLLQVRRGVQYFQTPLCFFFGDITRRELELW